MMCATSRVFSGPSGALRKQKSRRLQSRRCARREAMRRNGEYTQDADVGRRYSKTTNLGEPRPGPGKLVILAFDWHRIGAGNGAPNLRRVK